MAGSSALSTAELFLFLFIPLFMTGLFAVLFTWPSGFGSTAPAGVNPSIQPSALGFKTASATRNITEWFNFTIGPDFFGSTKEWNMPQTGIDMGLYSCSPGSAGKACFPPDGINLLVQGGDQLAIGVCNLALPDPRACLSYAWIDPFNDDMGLCSAWTAGNPLTCSAALNNHYDTSVKKASVGLGSANGFDFIEYFTFNTGLYSTPSQAWIADALKISLGVLGPSLAQTQSANNQRANIGSNILYSIFTFQKIDASEPSLSPGSGLGLFSFMISVFMYTLIIIGTVVLALRILGAIIP